MANPLSVRGTRRLLDGWADEIMEVAKKAAKIGASETVTGTFRLSGNFAFDKNGDVGIVGNVVVKVPDGSPVGTVLNIGADSEATVGVEFDSNGAGTLEMEVVIAVTVTPKMV